jgi:N6-adenosine-specific RNA methylase IME4
MRYPTMHLEEITALPIADLVEEPAHLYLWRSLAARDRHRS